jgi:hypothetical protein
MGNRVPPPEDDPAAYPGSNPSGRLPGERGELDDAAEMEAADQHPEDRPGHLILAEEEEAEARYHEGEPPQPADYVQEDTEPEPEEEEEGGGGG